MERDYVPVTVELYCVIGASVVTSGYPTVTWHL
jgi:hypothetical protein